MSREARDVEQGSDPRTDEEIVEASRRREDVRDWEADMAVLARRYEADYASLSLDYQEAYQTAWLRIFDSERVPGKRKFDPGKGAFADYFWKKVNSCLKDVRRRRGLHDGREPVLTDIAAGAHPDPEPSPEELVVKNENDREFLAALREALSEREYPLIVKRRIQDMSVELLMRETDASRATIYRVLDSAEGKIMALAAGRFFPQGLSFLSDAEREILRLRGEGESAARIAKNLGMSQTETRSLLASLAEKIGKRL